MKEPTPKLAAFAAFFIETYATTNNRPSTVREKRRALHRGPLDELGRLRLDQITPQLSRWIAEISTRGRSLASMTGKLAFSA